MRSRIIRALFVLVALVTPASMAAAADLLEQVPESAFLVVRFESIDKTVGNFKDMLGGISPAAAPAGDAFAQGIGEMLEVREGLDAIDGKAPLVVALLPYFDRPYAPAVILVKAKDEPKLRRAVLRIGDDAKDAKVEVKKRDDGFEEISRDKSSRKFYFGRRDDYVVYTRDEAVLKQLTTERNEGKSIVTALGPRAIKLLNAGDAGVAFNIAPVVEKHKDDIEKAREQVLTYIKDLPDEQLGAAGNAETVKKMYSEAANIAFHGVYDVSWFAGNVTFSSAGAKAEGFLGVKRFSLTDWVLMANPPAALDNLELLPAAASVYYGLQMNPHVMTGLMQEAYKMSYGGPVKDPEAMEKAVESMTDAKPGATVASFSFPPDEKTGMKTATISQAAAPKKLYEAYAEFIKAFGEVENTIFTQSLEYKPAAEKHKEHVIDMINISFKLKKPDSDEGRLIGGMLRRFFGGDALQERMTTLDKLTVQVTGNDPKLMQNMLDSFESGEGIVGLEKPFTKTRDALGKEANFVMMMNAPQMIVEFIAALKDVPVFGELLKAGELAGLNFSLKPPASYAGFSLSTEAQGFRVRAFVPVEQPRGILQIFVPGL